MRKGWTVAAVAAVLGVGGAASAHELTCEKHVNGEQVARVDTYPTTVEFTYRVRNVHPAATSVIDSVDDANLGWRGFVWTPGAPLALGVGQSADASFSLRLDSYEACLSLAMGDGRDDEFFDSDLRVMWALGETQCSARLICEQPRGCQGELCPTVRGPTRDEGFFKTHEQPLRACLASGPVDLGVLGQVTTAEQALGLLWGSPELFDNGQPRGEGDALRFDVGRQLLVATCNGRLFGTQPQDAALLERARTALSGVDCQGMKAARKALGTFNTSGAEEPQPAGFTPGTPAPVRARSVADDFTRPSGLGCEAAGSR
jgi:hypothetical protein